MSTRITRRRFVQSAAVAAVLPTIVSRNVLGANERLNVAGIGAGGKGAVDIGYCAGENIVALCDVDANNAASTFNRFPKATKYADFRKMLEKEEKHIDAVTVSTPDHLHAAASVMAMRMGKHVYCQKPLTHKVDEARIMTQVAQQAGVVTQMGNQGHSHPGTRRMVELIRHGVLGNVSEIHVWTDRPIWPQGQRAINERDKRAGEAVPSHLNWDLWLGPVADRPFNSIYLPFNWRGWWDFGTGALGDMGCHNMDTPFFALNLRDVTAVDFESSQLFDEVAPDWSVITYYFPKQGDRAACKLVWYDGRKKPAASLAKMEQLPNNGVIMVGDKDTLFVPSYWGEGRFVSGATAADYKDVPQTLPRIPNGEDNDRAHHDEWLAACRGAGKTLSNFDYAGPMTEAVLLGNVAMRAGGRIEWDAKAMKVTNRKDADEYVRHAYRKGWEL